MTVWDVARKDLVHSTRSVFLLVFALVLPLLTAGVFYAAFGGLSGGGEEQAIAAPRVVVVNRDGAGEAAKALADLLTGEELGGVWNASIAADPAAARAAVDAGEAAAAVIIPNGFSDSLNAADVAAGVEVYQDPAQSVGTAVIRSIVGQVLDGFAGMGVAMKTSGGALSAQGVPPDTQTSGRIAAEYTTWAQTQMGGTDSGLKVQSVAGAKQESADFVARMISAIMAMMMVFYCFFTGASAAQSILQEQEAGTLPRMFTTPVRRSMILAGKMLAVLVTLLLQLIILLAVSAWAFKIRWGDPLSIVLGVAGTGILSASFALFLTSFLRSTKQAGAVYGVVVNLVGWVGISRLFAQIIPGLDRYSDYTDVVSLLSPQGWAARIWQESMAGYPVWVTLVLMLLVSLGLFGIGVYKFNRRFSE
jgi:ABC-2 type transport system permease protein